MFEGLKKQLYFRKMNLLIKQGMANKKIVPFDDEFYKQMDHTYFNGLPISMHIKYLKPLPDMLGRCYDRALFMFFCFPEAVLVYGDNKFSEFEYGKNNAIHYWIEIGNYVYDPSLMMRFDKDLYYSIYMPTNVSKCTKAEYCSSPECKELYDNITGTTLKDLQPNGKKRIELITSIPLVRGIAEMSGNQDFIKELNEHLALIQYDEQQIFDELNSKLRAHR